MRRAFAATASVLICTIDKKNTIASILFYYEKTKRQNTILKEKMFCLLSCDPTCFYALLKLVYFNENPVIVQLKFGSLAGIRKRLIFRKCQDDLGLMNGQLVEGHVLK